MAPAPPPPPRATLRGAAGTDAPLLPTLRQDGFELRRYQPSDWVESASGSFMALFGYISDFGIPMTAPVLMSHGAEQDGTMAFYLSEPGPQPDGQDVNVVAVSSSTH